MRLNVLCASVVLLAVASPCLAAQPECLNNAPTQRAMDECVGRTMQASDQRLNETYRALLAKVGKDGGARLRKAQRAWLTWRDAQCSFSTMGTSGGSINASMYGLCIDELTQEQTKRLDAQLHCKEGDLSCGGQ
ncbi:MULTISPECIES: lysozyme inhibitor LprI family protein [unclassified Paraburkholderia]|uniref:lysozyme inhibitor LprI family protein n=1 Tax=unclassified Paraburkholderia TaxID=2615204 RepID=UPI002AB07E4C|nr:MULTISPECIES: lysozyme inhibitor LprI family protein [unclassified Paraburkholderia]